MTSRKGRRPLKVHRDFVVQLLGVIEFASKRRLRWGGDWYMFVDGKQVTMPVEDKLASLVQEHVERHGGKR